MNRDARKRLLKALGAVFGALLLGALGSGAWEKLLAPAFSWTVSSVVQLMSLGSHTFKDSVYREAAKGFHEQNALILVTLGLSLLAGAYFLLLIFSYIRKYERFREGLLAFSRFAAHRFALTLMTLSVLVMCAIMTMRAKYSNDIATFSLNSIEMLGGSVQPELQARLRAQFYMVRGADDFYRFLENLRAAAKQAGVELRKFDPI